MCGRTCRSALKGQCCGFFIGVRRAGRCATSAAYLIEGRAAQLGAAERVAGPAYVRPLRDHDAALREGA